MVQPNFASLLKEIFSVHHKLERDYRVDTKSGVIRNTLTWDFAAETWSKTAKQTC